MKLRTIALAASALAGVLVLAGCSGMTSQMPGMDNGSSSAAQFNDADVTFVMNMIVHHEQAIQMADVLLAKEGVDERVVKLAPDDLPAHAEKLQTLLQKVFTQHPTLGEKSVDRLSV